MTVTEFLHQHVPFLKGISQEQARSLAVSAEQRPYKSGQSILMRGVTVDGLHVIAAGQVAVYARTEKSKDAVEVARLGPGEVFGESSILEFTVAGATVKCSADQTLVFVIPEDAFREVLAADPALRERTLALIESRRAKKPA